MSDVIVEVRGGNIVAVYGRSTKTQVTIVDWDNLETGDTDIVEVVNCLSQSNMPEETSNIINSNKTSTAD
jgi:hypothetical protein